MNPVIPAQVVINVKCGHCKHFVSCGPVHVTPDSNVLCGRCRRLAKPIYRNVAFEAVASMYCYPCQYWSKHCNEKLQWNEALDHEKQCIYESSCKLLCSRPTTFFKSERKIPTDLECNLEHVPEDILENLKCLACQSYLSNKPVYIVPDGKNICHRCIYSNGIPDRAINNLAFETIAAGIIFPCIYRLRGCPVRLKFGRDLWLHEYECSYGEMSKKFSKKVKSKDGKEKERGVIQTHSGHIWGTITPHSALFAPPKDKNIEETIIKQELAKVMKKKTEETKNFDAQSMDSIMSKASTFDSLGDNISRSTADNISKDNVSRLTFDNISRDNISRDNFSRSSSILENKSTAETVLDENYRQSVFIDSKDQMRSLSPDFKKYTGTTKPPNNTGLNYEVYSEVTPPSAPIGYNRVLHNGYNNENTTAYPQHSYHDAYTHLYHFPPIYNRNTNFPEDYNNVPTSSAHTPTRRNESFRLGNPNLIDELKVRQHKKNSFSTQRDNQ